MTVSCNFWLFEIAFILLAIGANLNIVVARMNGYKMPAMGHISEEESRLYCPLTNETRLAFLGDKINIFVGYCSIGDLAITAAIGFSLAYWF